jgi:hypothetical protein
MIDGLGRLCKVRLSFALARAPVSTARFAAVIRLNEHFEAVNAISANRPASSSSTGSNISRPLQASVKFCPYDIALCQVDCTAVPRDACRTRE